ncbi:hypothetical protein [Streptomyces bullii]|uniref:Uncharacterized protein n=1 Tax=Streptomyces bullii TaxID=349910 RepID=A0ABW0UZR0_9ACTN
MAAVVVPATMETEVPEVLRRVAARTGDRFTLHAGRMRMKTVGAEKLAPMRRRRPRGRLHRGRGIAVQDAISLEVKGLRTHGA